ncbi:hypothetical protein ACFE04_021533 [Oxalis oulophora]
MRPARMPPESEPRRGSAKRENIGGGGRVKFMALIFIRYQPIRSWEREKAKRHSGVAHLVVIKMRRFTAVPSFFHLFFPLVLSQPFTPSTPPHPTPITSIHSVATLVFPRAKLPPLHPSAENLYSTQLLSMLMGQIICEEKRSDLVNLSITKEEK